MENGEWRMERIESPTSVVTRDLSKVVSRKQRHASRDGTAGRHCIHDTTCTVTPVSWYIRYVTCMYN